jgi:hypothetical protein
VQGRASLWEVGFAALGCIPATRGLTCVAEVRRATVGLRQGLGSATGCIVRWVRGGPSAGGRRTFSSPDPLVGDIANHVERAFPGAIRGVNVEVPMLDGRVRELDIDLGSLNIQVKSLKARGLQAQVGKTVETTGRRTIAYAPTMRPGAWRDAALKGVIVARDPEELVMILKEML